MLYKQDSVRSEQLISVVSSNLDVVVWGSLQQSIMFC